MKTITFLIKPVSGSCNMRCAYCFYADETQHREVASHGVMSIATLDKIVQLGMQNAEESCTFAFQGGEPLLAGLPFYETLISLEEKHNQKGITIHHTIQTNGLLVTDAWAAFFAKHNFLVGLSIDGTETLHNALRKTLQGGDTFPVVMQALRLLNNHGVPFNLLTVVTAQLAKKIDEVYAFYKEIGVAFQQYIPCLDPLDAERGTQDYSLAPALYADFLKRLFDLWYGDLTNGTPVSIRYFDNLASMLAGHPPESCGMAGRCGIYYLIEADGSVYPCDFYATDAYLLGNIHADGLPQLDAARRDIRFIEASIPAAPACRACRWAPLCRGGCRRDRQLFPDDALGLNYYCEAYRAFFPHAIGRLEKLATLLREKT